MLTITFMNKKVPIDSRKALAWLQELQTENVIDEC